MSICFSLPDGKLCEARIFVFLVHCCSKDTLSSNFHGDSIQKNISWITVLYSSSNYIPWFPRKQTCVWWGLKLLLWSAKSSPGFFTRDICFQPCSWAYIHYFLKVILFQKPFLTWVLRRQCWSSSLGLGNFRFQGADLNLVQLMT